LELLDLSKGILKKRLIILFITVIVIPLYLVIYNLIWVVYVSPEKTAKVGLTSEYSHLNKIDEFLLIAFLILIIFVSIFIYKNILVPLLKINKGVNAVKNGIYSERINMKNRDEIGEIACAFDSFAHDLEESNYKLELQNKELSDKNWELQEANFELEASYGQLQATIEQLNDAEQKYHSLVRNIPEVVCVVDNLGTISFINHICYEILGYEKSDLIGKNIVDLIVPKVSIRSVDDIISKLIDKSSLTLELPMKKKDGSVIITEANFTNYIYNGVNMGIQAIIRDITQKRKMEQDIIQSNSELCILNSVSKSLTSTLDLDELSKLIVKEINETLKFPACVLRLLDNDGINLNVKAFSGNFFKGVLNVDEFESIDINDDLIERMANNLEIIKITQIPDNMLISKINKDKQEIEKIKELLFVPLSLNNKKIGVLSIGSGHFIKSNDIIMITSIANNAVVAIDNAFLYESSKKYFIRTIDALIAAVEAKDKYTEGHSQRVSKYAVGIAQKIGLTKDQIEDIKIAGILHDIGKIGISDNILSKSGKLSIEEYEEIKQHPAISNKILYPVGFSDRALKAIAFHHERYDGLGYPFGLVGNDISMEAQIISVADAYDAMTSNRSYRMAMSCKDALYELEKNKHSQFNPIIVDYFIDLVYNTGLSA
jgi:PAS domain S-box-containing protein